jgi:predicted nucleic acid-binding protein
MVRSDKAILDTSVLICLYHLKLLDKLSLFFNVVRVPVKVQQEFLNYKIDLIEQSKRFEFLEEFYYTQSTWFIKCNEYNEDLIKIYKSEKNIDDGEAEVFAQNQSLGNDHIMLIDENSARSLAGKRQLAVHGVLYIIAILDLKFKICDYFKTVNKLKVDLKFRLSNKIINHVYNSIINS